MCCGRSFGAVRDTTADQHRHRAHHGVSVNTKPRQSSSTDNAAIMLMLNAGQHQVRDALVAMQQLITDATATGAGTVDPDALAEQVRPLRCGPARRHRNRTSIQRNNEEYTTRSPAGCATGKTITSASPPTGKSRPTTTDPNTTST